MIAYVTLENDFVSYFKKDQLYVWAYKYLAQSPEVATDNFKTAYPSFTRIITVEVALERVR